MKIEVFPWATIEDNLQDIKDRQKISKEELEKTVKILQMCLETY